MLKLYIRAMDTIGNIHRREEAQDGFEYLLVVGGVSVAVVIATIVVKGLIPNVIDAVKVAIKTVLPGIV